MKYEFHAAVMSDGTIPLSARQHTIHRVLAVFLVGWFCFGVVASKLGDEIYPSLSAPPFVRPENFDLNNLATYEYAVTFNTASHVVARAVPAQLLHPFPKGSHAAMFERIFLVPDGEGMVEKDVDMEFWQWLCTSVRVSPEDIDVVKVTEYRRRLVPKSKDAVPTGNGVIFSNPKPRAPTQK